MTQAFLLLGVMAVLLAFGVPVAFSIGLSSMIFLLTTGLKPMVVVAQSSVNGVDSFTMLAIPMFTLAGYLMESSGMSKRLVNCMEKLMGGSVGGVGTVTIVCCAIFAALTGSGPATVTAIGCIMLPAMLNAGYSRGETGGMLAAAGALGPIIPPSICMIVYGSTMSVSVPELFLAAVIPGILLAVSMVFANLAVSRRKFMKAAVKREAKVYSRREVMRSVFEALPTLFLPVIILGGIYSGIFTPTEVGGGGRILHDSVGRDLPGNAPGGHYPVAKAHRGHHGDGDVHHGHGGGLHVHTQRGKNSHGHREDHCALFKQPVCVYAADAGVAVYRRLYHGGAVPGGDSGAHHHPIGLQLGIDPIHLGVTFCITLVVGLATPPFGMNLFTASAVCETPFVEIVKGVWPYLIAVVITIFLIAFIPSLSLFLPGIL